MGNCKSKKATAVQVPTAEPAAAPAAMEPAPMLIGKAEEPTGLQAPPANAGHAPTPSTMSAGTAGQETTQHRDLHLPTHICPPNVIVTPAPLTEEVLLPVTGENVRVGETGDAAGHMYPALAPMPVELSASQPTVPHEPQAIPPVSSGDLMLEQEKRAEMQVRAQSPSKKELSAPQPPAGDTMDAPQVDINDEVLEAVLVDVK
eukprot:GDKI01011353.1.p1 GENE.GDKI01011353.1~~GDKI01011353.1.p1  ORF type:complete len:203 (-),score=54.58 GDKI01011353.1:609-1217(-)